VRPSGLHYREKHAAPNYATFSACLSTFGLYKRVRCNPYATLYAELVGCHRGVPSDVFFANVLLFVAEAPTITDMCTHIAAATDESVQATE